MQHDVTLKESAVLPNVAVTVLRPIVEGGTWARGVERRGKRRAMSNAIVQCPHPVCIQTVLES